MREYTVTGIRYIMGQSLPIEERTRLAKEFIKGIKVGTKVILEAENDNPEDENAIMVFVDYEFRGRIAREQCLEVRQLLDENLQAEAVVSRNDEELAFFVTIPGADEHKMLPETIQRKLPESPLGRNFKMLFSYEEKSLDMLSKKLTSMEIVKESVPDFIKMAEHYEPLLDMSICYDDEKRLSTIFDRLKWIRDKKNEFELSEDCLQRILKLHEQLHTRVRSMHRRWMKEKEKAFISHLDCLRSDISVTQYLYEKYCNTFLDSNDFADADKKQMQKERERLLKWFEDMEWIELRDPKQLEKMALKLTYLRVSRAEIYDIYSVLLLLEKLDENLQGNVPETTPSSDKLKKQKKTEKKTSDRPKTLIYYNHGNNGLLMKQRQRVVIIFRKWAEWGWIDDKTSPDDFDAFFEGEPRYCNITWTGNVTILTILLQELLKQPYIVKQTGCAAKSLVEQQFGKTANSDRKRLDEDTKKKIKITLFILNIKNPLPEIRERNEEEEFDTSDAALKEIYSGLLRSTKGI